MSSIYNIVMTISRIFNYNLSFWVSRL